MHPTPTPDPERPMTPQEFQTLMAPAMAAIAAHGGVDPTLQNALAAKLPPDGDWFAKVEAACHDAVDAGWMCAEGEGTRRFGRVIEPSPETQDLSVDVVDLADTRAPHHTHPNGEVLMIMPVDDAATFDARGRGWLVYGPGTGHRPTVRHGRALVLYLLPEGRIEWTGT